MLRRRRSSVVLSFSSLREPWRGEMNENGAVYQPGGGGGGVFRGVPLGFLAVFASLRGPQ